MDIIDSVLKDGEAESDLSRLKSENELLINTRESEHRHRVIMLRIIGFSVFLSAIGYLPKLFNLIQRL